MWGNKPRAVDAYESFTNAEGKVVEEHNLKRCCHCGSYWRTVVGSGITRGKCFKCNDFFCSSACQTCVPHEKMLEEESKRLQLFNKIMEEQGYKFIPDIII